MTVTRYVSDRDALRGALDGRDGFRYKWRSVLQADSVVARFIVTSV